MVINSSIQRAAERLDMYIKAEKAILSGAQSYNIGGQSLTRANLAEIRAGISECEAIINGGGRRRFTRLVPVDD